MGPKYSIKIPVELYGEEKISQLVEAIRQTSQQTNISGANLRGWTKAMEIAATAGYTMNTAINKVQASFKDANIDISAFTDRLKANLKAEADLAKMVSELSAIQDKASQKVVANAQAEVAARQKVLDAIKKEDEAKRKVEAGIYRPWKGTWDFADPGAGVDANVGQISRRLSLIGRSANIRSRYGDDVAAEWIRDQERAEEARAVNVARIAANRVAAAARRAERETARLNRPPVVPRIPADHTPNVIGRVGGRIIGAEIGSYGGLPGGGFIGSQLVQGLGLSGGAAIGVGVAGVAAFASIEMIKAAAETTKYAQAQQNLARETGMTIQQVQILGRVSEVTGTETQGLFGSLKSMNKELISTGPEAKRVHAALGELGLDAGLAFQSPQKQLEMVMTALKGVGSEAERQRLAVKLLGESGMQLLPLVNSFDSVSEAIKRTGVILSDEEIGRLSHYQEKLKEIELTWEHLKQKLTLGIVAPIVGILTAPGFGTDSPEESKQARFLRYRADAYAKRDAAYEGYIHAPVSEGQVESRAAYQRYQSAQARLDYNLSLGDPWGNKSGKEIIDAKNREAAARMVANAGRVRLYEARVDDDLGRTSVEKLKSELADLKESDVTARDAFVAGTGSRVDRDKIRSNIGKKEAQIKAAERYETELQEFGRLTPLSDMTPEEVASGWKHLSTGFGSLRKLPAYQQRLDATRGPASELLGAETEDHFRKALEKLLEHLGVEGAKTAADAAHRDRESIKNTEADARAALITSRGNLTMDESYAGLRGTARRGLNTFNRIGMTPSQLASSDYYLQMKSIGDSALPKGEALGREIAAHQNALSGLRGVNSDEAQRSRETHQAELDQKVLDLRALEVDTLTKTVDASVKFNEAVAKMSEQMRSEFGSGFAGIIMGAQHGSKSFTGALKGFGEGIETTMLQNVGKRVWDQGAGKIAGTIGKGMPDWLTQGTILGHVPDHKNPDLLENSLALRDGVAATRDLAAAFRGWSSTGQGSGGGPGGGQFSGGGTGQMGVGSGALGVAYQIAGADGLPEIHRSVYSAPTGTFGGDGPGGVANDITAMASVAGSLAGVAGGSTGAKLASVSKTLKGLDSVLKGTKYAGNIPKIFSGELKTGEMVGAIAGTAALGMAAYQGISTAARGGGKNVTGGIGMTLAAAAPFTGPAAPFVAAAGALLGMVSAFLPDAKQQRALEMEKRTFTQQYMAPQARNLMMGGNGAFADVDFMGNVRTSHLSPYPIVSNPYLDVPRRTVVPGHTISSLGGFQDVTGAKVPAVIHYHNWNVAAMDSKSIRDMGPALTDSVNHHINETFHPLISTIGKQLGTR